MAAEIRFSSFHTRILPIITGRVESISRDRLTDEQTKQPYFLAQIVADDIPALVKERLSAGMPADIIFPTGERTVLDYLVRPLKDRLRGVMREK
jgi:multidrug efflux pump subunit AcrA (membrane-fusion protein)